MFLTSLWVTNSQAEPTFELRNMRIGISWDHLTYFTFSICSHDGLYLIKLRDLHAIPHTVHTFRNADCNETVLNYAMPNWIKCTNIIRLIFRMLMNKFTFKCYSILAHLIPAASPHFNYFCCCCCFAFQNKWNWKLNSGHSSNDDLLNPNKCT